MSRLRDSKGQSCKEDSEVDENNGRQGKMTDGGRSPGKAMCVIEDQVFRPYMKSKREEV